MTRLVTCGFETGDPSEAGTSVIGSNGTITAVSTAPVPRAAGYCAKVTYTAVGNWAATYKSFPLGSAKTEVWMRFAFLAHALGTSEVTVVQLNDSAATNQATLGYTASDGLLRIYRGLTLVATASASFSQDTWHVIELRWQILTSTTGAAEVWLDGTRVVNFSGDTSQTTNLNMQSVNVGNAAQTSATGLTVNGTYVAFDDLAINDTAGSVNNGRPGDGRVLLLLPTGAGSSTALTRGGTDTGANYSQVNELPPSMTQYVLSATTTTRDLYALSDLPSGVASISVAEVLTLAQNSDAGAGSLGLTVKSGATTNEGTAQSLGTAAAYMRQQYETDPATTAAWTVSAINALEAGVTVR